MNIRTFAVLFCISLAYKKIYFFFGILFQIYLVASQIKSLLHTQSLRYSSSYRDADEIDINNCEI